MAKDIKVSMIAAMGKNRELGAGNDMLWHIPEDFTYFQVTTMGHPVVMGLKTYQSLPPKFRPLPGRTNIVLMRAEELSGFDAPEGVVAAHTLDDALAYAKDVAIETGKEEVFVIGGGYVYAQAMALADRLYITEIDAAFPAAEVFFPEYTDVFTNVVSERASQDDAFSYTFRVLE